MSAPALFAAPETTVRKAVRLLIEKRVSSVFVRTAPGVTGIVTERDILRAIDDGGEAGLSIPIESIMKAPLQTVAEDAFLYRAIGRIERLGFRHLGVTDAAGEIVGAVTTRNLLRHRATTAIMLGDEIDSAPSAAGLAAAWAQLPLMARNLMEEAVDPRTISAVVSSEICGMTRRAAELAQELMRSEGLENLPFRSRCLCSVRPAAARASSQPTRTTPSSTRAGSEDGPEDRYFARLGGHSSEILDAAGVPLCKGGVMARNREWRKSVSDWRATIDGWVQRQRPADLLNVDIFFDAVPVHGDIRLGEEIWNHADGTAATAARDFQNLLIELARRRGRPFTLLQDFIRTKAVSTSRSSASCQCSQRAPLLFLDRGGAARRVRGRRPPPRHAATPTPAAHARHATTAQPPRHRDATPKLCGSAAAPTPSPAATSASHARDAARLRTPCARPRLLSRHQPRRR